MSARARWIDQEAEVQVANGSEDVQVRASGPEAKLGSRTTDCTTAWPGYSVGRSMSHGLSPSSPDPLPLPPLGTETADP